MLDTSFAERGDGEVTGKARVTGVCAQPSRGWQGLDALERMCFTQCSCIGRKLKDCHDCVTAILIAVLWKVTPEHSKKGFKVVDYFPSMLLLM